MRAPRPRFSSSDSGSQELPVGQLVNQHQLAAHLRRSRASIVSWAKAGMPIARRGGPGKPTLYDVEQVQAWLERTGRGIALHRPELPPMPRRRPETPEVP